MIGDVLWLLRFARPATAKLAGSIAARLIGHLCAAAMIALPAWALGEITAAHLRTGGLPGYQGAAAEPAGVRFLAAVVGGFLLLAVVRAACRYLEQLLGHVSAFSLMGEMRVWMIDRLIPQAPAVTDGTGAARIHAVAVRDVDRVEVFFAHTIAPAVTALAVPALAVAVAAAAAGPSAALALALVLLLGVVLPLPGGRAARRTARESAQVRADIAQHIADSLRLREEIRALEAEPARADSLGALDARLGRSLRGNGLRSGLRHALSQLRVWLGTAVVLAAGLPASAPEVGAGASAWADGAIAALPGALLAAALVPGTAGTLETIERLASSLPAGLEATRRIRELGAGRPVVAEPTGAPASASALASARASAPASASSGQGAGAPDRVRFEHVAFRYPGSERDVLHGIDLALRSGGFIGVVGATGSGKSTIARLAQRHFDPQGRVLVDGVPAPELGSARVRELIAVADQEPFLLSATVEENLRLADPAADPATLDWARSVAELELPLDRAVGRRGDALSGGQRQRLALARTLVRAASGGSPGAGADAGVRTLSGVLVLDEATSHQDPLTQARIVANLRRLGAGMIVIAHRLDVVRDADRILVLEEGRIVEQGTWDELAAAGGAFAALLEAEPHS